MLKHSVSHFSTHFVCLFTLMFSTQPICTALIQFPSVLLILKKNSKSAHVKCFLEHELTFLSVEIKFCMNSVGVYRFFVGLF